MARQKESLIKKQILDYLLKCSTWNIIAWNNPNNAVYDPRLKMFRKNKSKHSMNGVSDIIGICNGHPLFIEVKTKVGKPSDDQTRFLNLMKDHKAIAFVARDVSDIDYNIKEQLAKLDNHPQ